MDPNERQELLSSAYAELHATLSAILYEEDPLGAGSTVGSPSDEYDGEAARTAAVLRQTRGDARAALTRIFAADEISEALVSRVSDAWHAFSAKISST